MDFDRQLLLCAFVLGLHSRLATALPPLQLREPFGVSSNGRVAPTTTARSTAHGEDAAPSSSPSPSPPAANPATTDGAKNAHRDAQECAVSGVAPSSTCSANRIILARTQDTATRLSSLHLPTLSILGSASASQVELASPISGAGSPTPQTSAASTAHQPHDTLLQSSFPVSSGPFPNHTVASGSDKEVQSSNDAWKQIDIHETTTVSDLLRIAALPGNATPAVTAMSTAIAVEPTTTNALGILFSALPSSVAASLESEYSIATSYLSTPTSISSSSPSTSPTSTFSSASSTSSTSPITSSSSSSSASTSSTLSTSLTGTSTTASATSQTTTAAPTGSSDSSSSSSPSNGAVAGIAVGTTAGVVFVVLAILLLLKRRKTGQYPWGRRRSKESGRAYPEIAWLYDPSPTPPRSSSQQGRDRSSASLLPRRPPETAVFGGVPPGSPQMRAVGPESPLLPPPQMHVTLDDASQGGSHNGSSGGGGGGGGGVSTVRSPARGSDDGRRPLYRIYEETHAQ